jgi:hypothetical protein
MDEMVAALRADRMPQAHKNRLTKIMCDALEILVEEDVSIQTLHAYAIAFFL